MTTAGFLEQKQKKTKNWRFYGYGRVTPALPIFFRKEFYSGLTIFRSDQGSDRGGSRSLKTPDMLRLNW